MGILVELLGKGTIKIFYWGADYASHRKLGRFRSGNEAVVPFYVIHHVVVQQRKRSSKQWLYGLVVLRLKHEAENMGYVCMSKYWSRAWAKNQANMLKPTRIFMFAYTKIDSCFLCYGKIKRVPWEPVAVVANNRINIVAFKILSSEYFKHSKTETPCPCSFMVVKFKRTTSIIT